MIRTFFSCIAWGYLAVLLAKLAFPDWSYWRHSTTDTATATCAMFLVLIYLEIKSLSNAHITVMWRNAEPDLRHR